MNTGLTARIGGPGFLDELPDRLMLPLLLEFPPENRHLAPRRVDGGSRRSGRSPPRRVPSRSVAGRENKTPRSIAIVGPPVELGEVPVIAEHGADEGLVVRDLELVHRRTSRRSDPPEFPRRSPPDRTLPAFAAASGSRPISRAIRDAARQLRNRASKPSIGHGVQGIGPERVPHNPARGSSRDPATGSRRASSCADTALSGASQGVGVVSAARGCRDDPRSSDQPRQSASHLTTLGERIPIGLRALPRITEGVSTKLGDRRVLIQ